MKACAGPGKSATLSWLIWNFMLTRPRPRVAAVSISWANLRDNLWSELAKWRAQSRLLEATFEWTKTKIFARQHPGLWWCSARTWDRSADPDQQGQALSGLHDDYAMAVADETGAMPAAVIQTASAVLAGGKETKLVIAGNPTHLAGPLHSATIEHRRLWHVIEVTGDPDDPERAPRVDLDWAREMVDSYGRDNPFVRSKVLGKFPKHASDALLGLHHFEDAYERHRAEDGSALQRGFKRLGVDVARFGADRTLVAKRDGDYHDGFDAWAGKDLAESTARVAAIALAYRAQEICVDDIGLGGGLTDGLRRRADLRRARCQVRGINVGNPSKVRDRENRPRFANLKAEYSFAMLEQYFGPGCISLSKEVRTSPLEAQATDVRYAYSRGAQTLCIEAKEDFRRRHGGKSPDEWDATVLAFAPPRRGPAVDFI
jgi:hypothetical protein